MKINFNILWLPISIIKQKYVKYNAKHKYNNFVLNSIF